MEIKGIETVNLQDDTLDVLLYWEFTEKERNYYKIPVEIVGEGRSDEPALVVTFDKSNERYILKSMYFDYLDVRKNLDPDDEQVIREYLATIKQQIEIDKGIKLII